MNDTFLRQLKIFNPQQYDQYNIVIIGCGAVGSFIGITLAKLGLKNFTLVDYDKVEEHNLPNQFFSSGSVGSYKVDALKLMMKMLSPRKDITINASIEKFIATTKIQKPIVFSCVDSMKVRKQIFDICLEEREDYHIHSDDKPRVLIDTRMGGQVFEVNTVNLTKTEATDDYQETLHSDADAEQTPCTERSIIYNVLAVSALAVNQLVKVLNNEKYKQEVTGDLINVMVK